MENIDALVLTIMSTNKAEPVEVNGYVDIPSNDEAANPFYIFCFTFVPYMI